jgi:hypothetical protein
MALTSKCPICGKNIIPLTFPKANDGTACCPEHIIEYNKILLQGGGRVTSTVSNAEADSKKAEAEAAKSAAQASAAQASAAKAQARAEMFNSITASADAEDNQMREAIDYINKMIFSSEIDELSNQLNELVSTGASSDKFRNGKTLKKACYEKMEFGILKLRQTGSSVEADFFEKKRKGIKPGWF